MTDIRHAQLELAKSQAELEAVLLESRPEGAGHAAEGEEAGKKSASDSDSKEPKHNKHKKPGTARGIETLFRSAYRVQMDLTSLADNKANMMITINGIIMSIIIASVAPKLDTNPWLLVPTTVLLLGSMVSIIYSILAARPRVSPDSEDPSELEHGEGNILFFGNFARLSEDEFVAGMEELMANKAVVYEAMIRNIHGLGKVLQRKFALLRTAYTAFMFALLAGVASFLVVFVWVLRQAPLS